MIINLKNDNGKRPILKTILTKTSNDNREEQLSYKYNYKSPLNHF